MILPKGAIGPMLVQDSPGRGDGESQHNWMSKILNDVYWYCPH